MKKLTFLLLSALLAGFASAQSGTDISGMAVNVKGQPVKNVRLKVQGSKSSAKTKKDGLFTLKAVAPDDSIEVLTNDKRIVYFPAGDYKNITLKLSKDSLILIGDNGKPTSYKLGLRPQKGNSSIVTAEMLENKNFTSLRNVMSSMMSYVRLEQGSGGTEAIIRGYSSINSSNAALVLVNGTEMSFDMANDAVDVYSIKSIEVNKTGDGYGIRGANGVIIIKTK